MSRTEFYSRISCSFGSVKKVHLVIFSDVSRSSKSQNSLISGCEIGTSRYTGFSFFFGCLLVSIAIFPMKHQMKPRLSQNKTSWPGVRTEIIIRTQQTQGSSRGGFMSHITPKRDPRPYRLVHWQTVEHGYSSEECGGNHEPRSFLSGYRFFCELQRK